MGLAVGVVLANVGFADYGELHKVLTFNELRMLISFGLAIAMAAIVFVIFAKTHTTTKENISSRDYSRQPVVWYWLGGLWRLSGHCLCAVGAG